MSWLPFTINYGSIIAEMFKIIYNNRKCRQCGKIKLSGVILTDEQLITNIKVTLHGQANTKKLGL